MKDDSTLELFPSQNNMKEMISDSWYELLKDEFEKDYFKSIARKVKTDRKRHTVRPISSEIFRAFNFFRPEETKVIIIGQDPYPHRHACGLAFSTRKHVISDKYPKSLKVIAEEINRTCGELVTGDLSVLAEQGVLLLNSCLTVIDGKPGSHGKIGWQTFTDRVCQKLVQYKPVVMLWGNYAKKKKHLFKDCYILEDVHPSSYYYDEIGFIGNNHFKLANEYLQKTNRENIYWSGLPF